jgi:hypothetical protein
MALLVAAGCGQGDEPASTERPRATTTGASGGPVAYRLPSDAVRGLVTADAWQVIEREGQVVARSEWKPYTAVVLSEWLEDHGVRLDVPKELRAVVERVASEQELPLLVVGPEHRGYAGELARLHPTARELQSFHERFTEEPSAEAGRAMLDWLRVFRAAVEGADDGHLVVIPVLD